MEKAYQTGDFPNHLKTKIRLISNHHQMYYLEDTDILCISLIYIDRYSRTK